LFDFSKKLQTIDQDVQIGVRASFTEQYQRWMQAAFFSI
jgi:hypothetical protein